MRRCWDCADYFAVCECSNGARCSGFCELRTDGYVHVTYLGTSPGRKRGERYEVQQVQQNANVPVLPEQRNISLEAFGNCESDRVEIFELPATLVCQLRRVFLRTETAKDRPNRRNLRSFPASKCRQQAAARGPLKGLPFAVLDDKKDCDRESISFRSLVCCTSASLCVALRRVRAQSRWYGRGGIRQSPSAWNCKARWAPCKKRRNIRSQ